MPKNTKFIKNPYSKNLKNNNSNNINFLIVFYSFILQNEVVKYIQF